MSEPVQSVADFEYADCSSSNLKAHYMPINLSKEISFCGSKDKNKKSSKTEKGTDKAKAAAEKKAKEAAEKKAKEAKENRKIKQVLGQASGEDVTRLKAYRIKGDYGSDFSDDLAILLRTHNHVLLEMEPGVNPEVFAHLFANRLQAVEKAKGGKKTRVIYIENPELAVTSYDTGAMFKILKDKPAGEIDVEEAIEQASKTVWQVAEELYGKKGTNTIVVVNEASDAFNQSIIPHGLSIGGFLSTACPNVVTVNLVEKTFDEDDKHIPLREIKTLEEDATEVDIPVLKLKGLGSQDTKAFFRENPDFADIVLSDYKEAKLFIKPEVLDLLIDRTALISDIAMPDAVCEMLDMVAAAKINESKGLDKRDVFIEPDDVNAFFLNHPRLVDLQRPKAGRFRLAENVTVKLSDVGGCHAVKEAITEDILPFLKDPKKFIEERGSAPKGILLEGPPGNGKTLLARATAGETSTPFFAVSGSEFVEIYVGTGAKRVRELFKTAREAAENAVNKTAIIFIDEFDALARKRNGALDGNEEAEQTLDQLLTEMDGFDNKESKIKIVVMAATNRKDILDKAAIRRFDDTLTVSNPQTIAERLEILNVHAKKLPFASEEEKTKILAEAAKMTDDMSGDDIAKVMKKARKVVSKREMNKVITHNDIVEGYLQVLAGPVDKATSEMSLAEIKNTVRHEAGHAFMIDLLKPLLGEKISFITLEPRGNFLGAVFHHPEAKTTPDFKSVILSGAVNYAGGMSEPEYHRIGNSAGVSVDIKHATDLFKEAITEWGLGRFTPPIAITPELAKLYQAENKKDFELMSNASRKISQIGLDFGNSFLDEYMKMFETSVGKGGTSFSGEAFSKMRQEWLVKTGKVEAEKRLLNQVAGIVDDAFHANKGFSERFARKALRKVLQLAA